MIEATATAADHDLALLAQMLRIRRFEEQAAECYMSGQIRGFLHLYVGEEAVAVGTMGCLTAEDRVVAAYRDHGHALARGLPMATIMAEMFGKVTGCCRGRGGSMHLFDVGRRFYGGTAIVGAELPLAVGLALADRLQQSSSITAVFFGDGAVAEGTFHESLNLAALWQLPVLFLCENNLYAMGTRLDRHQAMTDIHAKAAGYGIAAAAVDGMDVRAVEAAAREAAESVRDTGMPFLLEARTYRLRAHSMYDPDRYRPREEVASWQAREPVASFADRLRAEGRLDDVHWQRLEQDVAAEVAAAVAAAAAAPVEPEADLTRDLLVKAEPVEVNACPG